MPLFNYSLEGLRGMCAITVAFSHVQSNMILFSDAPSWLSYFSFGHVAVLIFFVLSGYVIGISYPTKEINTKQYLKKRFFRIYPIYLITVLLCMLLEPQLNISSVLSQIFLLQNILPTFISNVVLWSINYEVIFYLLFLIVPHQPNKLLQIIIGCSFLSFVSYLQPAIPPFIGGYLAGFSFWLCGLYISKIKAVEYTANQKPLICLLFTAMLYSHLAPGHILLNGLGLKPVVRSIVSIADLAVLPFCFLIIVEAGNLKVNKLLIKTLYILVFAIPFIVLLFIVLKGRFYENLRWQFCGLFFCLSVIFYFIRQTPTLLAKLAFWGSLSYAVYIVHYPLGFFLGNIYQPQLLTHKLVLFSSWIILTVALAYFLEKIFQPLVKKRERKKPLAANIQAL